MCAFVSVYVCLCVCACVRVCVGLCMYACVCVYVCENVHVVSYSMRACESVCVLCSRLIIVGSNRFPRICQKDSLHEMIDFTRIFYFLIDVSLP